MGDESVLKDTITYGGQSILVIYHENRELDVPGRHWREREKIGRYWLEFEETSGHPAEEFPAEGALTERALLPGGHPLSPCASQEFCAIMTRQRSREKPSRIFLPDQEGLRLSREQWESLCEFVKTYTGMDLSKAPLACGDTFLFHYVQLCYRETSEGAILVDTWGFDRIDIHFKRGEAICGAQCRHLEPADRTEVTFVPEEDWDTFDLYAYEDDQLWFCARDVVFMGQLHLRLNFGDKRSVPLQKNGYCPRYSSLEGREIEIGREREILRKEQDRQEARLLAASAKKSEYARLIRKGDDRAVYRMANQLLDHRWNEVLLLDPYLLDTKGREALIDWMRLLCASPAKHICAVYYRKAETEKTTTAAEAGRAMTAAEAGRVLAMDWPLSQVLRRNSGVLRLLGLDECIHDRFLLCRRGRDFAGISMGTSVNSLHSNYFCVYHLTAAFARECWETFEALIRSHTVETEVIHYG